MFILIKYVALSGMLIMDSVRNIGFSSSKVIESAQQGVIKIGNKDCVVKTFDNLAMFQTSKAMLCCYVFSMIFLVYIGVGEARTYGLQVPPFRPGKIIPLITVLFFHFYHIYRPKSISNTETTIFKRMNHYLKDSSSSQERKQIVQDLQKVRGNHAFSERIMRRQSLKLATEDIGILNVLKTYCYGTKFLTKERIDSLNDKLSLIETSHKTGKPLDQKSRLTLFEAGIVYRLSNIDVTHPILQLLNEEGGDTKLFLLIEKAKSTSELLQKLYQVEDGSILIWDSCRKIKVDGDYSPLLDFWSLRRFDHAALKMTNNGSVWHRIWMINEDCTDTNKVKDTVAIRIFKLNFNKLVTEEGRKLIRDRLHQDPISTVTSIYVKVLVDVKNQIPKCILWSKQSEIQSLFYKTQWKSNRECEDYFLKRNMICSEYISKIITKTIIEMNHLLGTMDPDDAPADLFTYVDSPFGKHVNLDKISPNDLVYKFSAIEEVKDELNPLNPYVDLQS